MKTMSLITKHTFDPQFGFNIIKAGSLVTLYPTTYSNYVFYLTGYDFHTLGYPMTDWDMEKMFGSNWKQLINN